MSKWKTYRLGDIIQLKSGGTPDKSNPDYWGGSIPWISAKSMYDDFISTSDLFITEEGLQAGSKIAKKDSILLLTRGSGLFNRIPVCYVVSDVAYNQDVKNIVLKQEDVTSIKFLYYWLYGNKELLSSMLETTGIGAGKIDTKRFLNLSISLPSQKEQARYIHLMDLLFDKIELNRRINANLEAQAQALFRSWFVDFEPFRDGPFVDSELGKIPQGWKVAELGDVTKQQTEKVGPQKTVKVLSPITTGELVLSEEYFTKQVFSESIAKYIIVKPDQFAYNPARINIGSIGRNTFEFDGCVSPVYVVFECEKGYHYFFDFFRKTDAFKQEVISRAIGGVRQTLGYKDFALIKVIYPPQNVVQEFNALYINLLNMQNHNKLEITTLSALRDTMLPKLMAGEIAIE
jgi:type I restriction-modification system specificity protein